MCYNFICYERFVDKNLWCCDLVWNSWQCIHFPLFGVFSDQVKLGRDIGSVRQRPAGLFRSRVESSISGSLSWVCVPQHVIWLPIASANG